MLSTNREVVFHVRVVRACEAVRVKFASVVGVCLLSPCPAAAALAPRCSAGVPLSFSFSSRSFGFGLRSPNFLYQPHGWS